jgi:ribosomal protein S18 acetylase RimI-like enzyme
MNLAIMLRAAKPDDRAFVERVYFETQRWIIEQLFGWRGDDLERGKFAEFYDEENTAIVTDGKTDIGWLTVQRSPDRIEIDSIYIVPTHQRLGIGTYLLRQLIDEARSNDQTATLSTAKVNPALRLYERLGFSVSHETDFKLYLEWRPHR